MDASDSIRIKKSKVYYINSVTNFTKAQPSADCANKYCSTISTCVLTFPSYEERQLFKDGRKNCS